MGGSKRFLSKEQPKQPSRIRVTHDATLALGDPLAARLIKQNKQLPPQNIISKVAYGPTCLQKDTDEFSAPAWVNRYGTVLFNSIIFTFYRRFQVSDT